MARGRSVSPLGVLNLGHLTHGRYVSERLEVEAWCSEEKSGLETQVRSHPPVEGKLMFWEWSTAPRMQREQEEQPGRSPEAPHC